MRGDVLYVLAVNAFYGVLSDVLVEFLIVLLVFKERIFCVARKETSAWTWVQISDRRNGKRIVSKRVGPDNIVNKKIPVTGMWRSRHAYYYSHNT